MYTRTITDKRKIIAEASLLSIFSQEFDKSDIEKAAALVIRATDMYDEVGDKSTLILKDRRGKVIATRKLSAY